MQAEFLSDVTEKTLPQENITVFNSLLIPINLTGAKGENRATDCRINATNDLEAIKSWLAIKGGNSKTYQAYQKELERFLVWAVLERGKAFSSLNTDDCQAYIEFLKNLQASNTRWVTIIPTSKSNTGWKPFQYRANQRKHDNAPILSIRSINYANTVISSCMDWLVKQNYLKYNDFANITAIKAPLSNTQIKQRLFTKQHIESMLDYAETLVNNSAPDYYAKLRVVFVLKFAFSTGLRLHELVGATYGDIECVEEDTDTHYFLRVTGKNSKFRKTSLPTLFIEELRRYRIAQGLPAAFENAPSDEALINRLRQKNGIQALTPAGLHKILSTFFKQWLTHLNANPQPDTRLINKVKKASAHWLRHSYGSFLANDCQIPLGYIRDELGHANIATTSIYLNSDDNKRRQAVNTAFATSKTP